MPGVKQYDLSNFHILLVKEDDQSLEIEGTVSLPYIFVKSSCTKDYQCLLEIDAEQLSPGKYIIHIVELWNMQESNPRAYEPRKHEKFHPFDN